MALADTLSALAIKLLNKYGATVTVTQQVQGTYDPTTSSQAITTNSMTIKGLPEEYAESLRTLGFKLQQPGDSGVNADKKITIAGTSLLFQPSVGDKVTFAAEVGNTYGITGIGKFWVNDVNPALVLHLSAH